MESSTNNGKLKKETQLGNTSWFARARGRRARKKAQNATQTKTQTKTNKDRKQIHTKSQSKRGILIRKHIKLQEITNNRKKTQQKRKNNTLTTMCFLQALRPQALASQLIITYRSHIFKKQKNKYIYIYIYINKVTRVSRKKHPGTLLQHLFYRDRLCLNTPF
jgi:hypothetical protein